MELRSLKGPVSNPQMIKRLKVLMRTDTLLAQKLKHRFELDVRITNIRHRRQIKYLNKDKLFSETKLLNQ